MLLDGENLIRGLQVAAGDPEGRQPEAARAARLALVLLEAPPPSSRADAERRRQSLEEIAEKLREAGESELASEVDAAVRALARLASARDAGTAALPESPRPRPAGAENYPPEYAELLARYFAGNAGQGSDL